MGLLDELKKKAEAAKEAVAEIPRVSDERANEIRAVALPAIFRIHHALSELVAQLKVLQQEDPAALTIAGIGEVAGSCKAAMRCFQRGRRGILLRCARISATTSGHRWS